MTVSPMPGLEELRVEALGSLEGMRQEWSVLAERDGNFFGTWEWIATWWRHLGDGRELRLLALRRPGGELAALIPLFLAEEAPARVLRFIGHVDGDRLGPVCEPAERERTIRSLPEILASAPWGFDALIGDELPREEGFGTLPGVRVVKRTASPVLRLDFEGWDDFLRQRSANFRSQLGARERRLARTFRVGYRTTEEADSLQHDLSTLFRLHSARWSEPRTFAGAREAFHRDLATRLLERGWLRLRFLDVDGRPVAAIYCFRFGGVEWYYQAGRDPAFDGYSVGTLLLAHAIREALAEGAGEFRFLRGDEPYKYRFADLDPGLETVGLASTPAGRDLLESRFESAPG